MARACPYACLSAAALYPDLAAAIRRIVIGLVATRQAGTQSLCRWGFQAGSACPGCKAGWLAANGRLVFGREDSRPSATMNSLQAGRILRIPTDPAYPSINLSHAVAVILQSLRHGGPARPQHAAEPASRGSLPESRPGRAESVAMLKWRFLCAPTSRPRPAWDQAEALRSAPRWAVTRGPVARDGEQFLAAGKPRPDALTCLAKPFEF